jgi:hypothetical protein
MKEEGNMSGSRGKVAVVGTKVPTGRYPDTAAIYHAIESAKQAIKDAGIHKDEIDFVMPTAALFSPQFNTELVTCRVVEELGLKNVKKNCQVFAGGRRSAAFRWGSMIASRAAKMVCLSAERLGTSRPREGIDLSRQPASGRMEALWQHCSSIAHSPPCVTNMKPDVQMSISLPSVSQTESGGA